MRRILVDQARPTRAAKRGGADAKQSAYPKLKAIQGLPDAAVPRNRTWATWEPVTIETAHENIDRQLQRIVRPGYVRNRAFANPWPSRAGLTPPRPSGILAHAREQRQAQRVREGREVPGIQATLKVPPGFCSVSLGECR
jgi:hypothetical protein